MFDPVTSRGYEHTRTGHEPGGFHTQTLLADDTCCHQVYISSLVHHTQRTRGFCKSLLEENPPCRLCVGINPPLYPSATLTPPLVKYRLVTIVPILPFLVTVVWYGRLPFTVNRFLTCPNPLFKPYNQQASIFVFKAFCYDVTGCGRVDRWRTENSLFLFFKPGCQHDVTNLPFTVLMSFLRRFFGVTARAMVPLRGGRRGRRPLGSSLMWEAVPASAGLLDNYSMGCDATPSRLCCMMWHSSALNSKSREISTLRRRDLCSCEKILLFGACLWTLLLYINDVIMWVLLIAPPTFLLQSVADGWIVMSY